MGTKTQPQPQKGEFQQNLIQINNKQDLLFIIIGLELSI